MNQPSNQLQQSSLYPLIFPSQFSHAVENANIVPLGGTVPLLTPGGGSTSTTLPVNADDRLVLDKLEQIQLDVDQRWFVNQMAKLVESAMLKVSMQIESERKGFTAHAAADDAVPPLLCKPQRVGHLASNLLLRSDRRVRPNNFESNSAITSGRHGHLLFRN